MLKNYLLTSFRHLSKNSLFSTINIFGLALGIASFMLIFSYVRFEYSYDQINEEIEDIFRVESIFYKSGVKTDHWPTSTNGAGLAIQQSFPDVTDMTRINWHNSDRVVRFEDQKFRENHVCFADSNFFTFFDYPIIKGNRKEFLTKANTVVISESAAKKYFGDGEAIGQRMQFSTFSNTFDCEVTGVFVDLPRNHTMQFDFLISWPTSGRWMWDFWYLHESYTYIKVSNKTRINEIEELFPTVAEKFKTRSTLKDHIWAIDLVPLKDVHLNPAKPYEIEAKGNKRSVDFLSIVCLVILIIAWVNYINLSTARSIERAKEVGIRKVAGSYRSQLIIQFMSESAIVNIIAGLISLLLIFLATLTLPEFIGDILSLEFMLDLTFIATFASVVVIGIFLSGIYPALVLSSFKPASILKGKYESSKAGALLRQGLVVIQFTITVILIVSTVIVDQQINFMKNQSLGVNIQKTLVIEAPVKNDRYFDKLNSFKEELRQMSDIKYVTRSSAIPGKEVAKFLANRYEYAPENEQRLCEMLKVDFDYIETFEMELVAGRDFDINKPTDSVALILNQAAVSLFGFSSDEDAINKRIILEVTPDKRNHIIGVVKNYHQQSLQKDHTPIILFMDPDYNWIPITYFSLKLNTSSVHQSVAQIQDHWESFFPESSFDYFFLDEFFERQYQSDLQYGNTVATFSLLAIIIAILGLFGLTLLNATAKTKEIGIRKVLGASVAHILTLLNVEIIKLILISGILSIPISYFLIVQWLDEYAFRLNLSWWMFVGPVLLVMIVAVCTASYLTFNAAVANPIHSIRDE